jgi:hypothetical protein
MFMIHRGQNWYGWLQNNLRETFRLSSNYALNVVLESLEIINSEHGKYNNTHLLTR